MANAARKIERNSEKQQKLWKTYLEIWEISNMIEFGALRAVCSALAQKKEAGKFCCYFYCSCCCCRYGAVLFGSVQPLYLLTTRQLAYFPLG